MKALRIPRGIFNAVCYSPDGQFLLGLHSGWRLRAWATADLSERFAGRLPGILYAHHSLALCGDLAVLSQGVYDLRDLWAALRQSAGRVRDAGLIREVRLQEPASIFARFNYCTNGRVILRTLYDYLSEKKCCRLSFWDAGGRWLRDATCPYFWHAPALSADGTHLAYLREFSATVVGLEDGTSVDLKHTDAVRHAEFSPDGRQLAVASGRSLWLWDLARGKGERFPAFQKFVEAIAFHPDGHLLAVADRAGEIRVLQVPGGRQQASLNFGVGGVAGLAFSPDGMTVAAAGRDNAAVIWDLE